MVEGGEVGLDEGAEVVEDKSDGALVELVALRGAGDVGAGDGSCDNVGEREEEELLVEVGMEEDCNVMLLLLPSISSCVVELLFATATADGGDIAAGVDSFFILRFSCIFFLA